MDSPNPRDDRTGASSDSWWRRNLSAIRAFFTGKPNLTPAQRAVLDEMEKDYTDWKQKETDPRDVPNK